MTATARHASLPRPGREPAGTSRPQTANDDHVEPGGAVDCGRRVDLPGALLVCSSGGHLDQLMRLEPWWADRPRNWVTFRLPDAESRLTGEEVVWAHHPTTRNVWNLLRNLVLARATLARLRPAVVVSTGAGLALPFFMLARLYGARTVYLEVFDRVTSRTLTGKLCRPLSDLFLVQWPEQQQLYRDSVLIGSVYP